MISALTFVAAAIVVLLGPVTTRQRRQVSPDVHEGIWVERSSEKEPARVA